MRTSQTLASSFLFFVLQWFCIFTFSNGSIGAYSLIKLIPTLFSSTHSSDVSNKSFWSYSNSRLCNRLCSLRPRCLVGATWPSSRLSPSPCWRFRGRRPSRWNSGRSNHNRNHIRSPLSRTGLKTELYLTFVFSKGLCLLSLSKSQNLI